MADKQALQQRAKWVSSFKTFLEEINAERKKVVWPTREVLTQATLSVLLMVFVLSIYMGIADYILRRIFDFLIS